MPRHTKRLRFKFRWPVIQVSETEVDMNVPISEDGKPLVLLNDQSEIINALTNREHDTLLNSLEDKAIRELAILPE